MVSRVVRKRPPLMSLTLRVELRSCPKRCFVELRGVDPTVVPRMSLRTMDSRCRLSNRGLGPDKAISDRIIVSLRNRGTTCTLWPILECYMDSDAALVILVHLWSCFKRWQVVDWTQRIKASIRPFQEWNSTRMRSSNIFTSHIQHRSIPRKHNRLWC